jgi:hypothetical protein
MMRIRSAACMLMTIIILSTLCLPLVCHGFAQVTSTRRGTTSTMVLLISSNRDDDDANNVRFDDTPAVLPLLERRHLLQRLSVTAAKAALSVPILLTTAANTAVAAVDAGAAAEGDTKFVQQSYEDFIKTPEGWSYREVKPGSGKGEKAQLGDRVVFQWSGYTIGYFGRPFQAQGGPQGVSKSGQSDVVR